MIRGVVGRRGETHFRNQELSLGLAPSNDDTLENTVSGLLVGLVRLIRTDIHDRDTTCCCGCGHCGYSVPLLLVVFSTVVVSAEHMEGTKKFIRPERNFIKSYQKVWTVRSVALMTKPSSLLGS